MVKQCPHCLQPAFLLPSTKWAIRRALLGEKASKGGIFRGNNFLLQTECRCLKSFQENGLAHAFCPPASHCSSCMQSFSSQLIEIQQQFSLRQELSMDAEQEPNFTRDPLLLTTFLWSTIPLAQMLELPVCKCSEQALQLISWPSQGAVKAQCTPWGTSNTHWVCFLLRGVSKVNPRNELVVFSFRSKHQSDQGKMAQGLNGL